MAVNHMVWIRFRPEIPAERIDAHMAALRGMVGVVPGVLGLTCGANFTDRANGCTHGVAVLLESREALKAYAVHPVHAAIAAGLRADGDVLALDYDC
jgi:hypothetical protein